MSETLLMSLTGIVSAVITAVGTWLVTHKKSREAIRNTEIENMRVIISEWQQTAMKWKEMADDYHRLYVEASKSMDNMCRPCRYFSRRASIKYSDDKKESTYETDNQIDRNSHNVIGNELHNEPTGDYNHPPERPP